MNETSVFANSTHGPNIAIPLRSVSGNRNCDLRFNRAFTWARLVLICILAAAVFPSLTLAEPPKEVSNSIGMKFVLLPEGKVRPSQEIKDYSGTPLNEFNQPGSKKKKPAKSKEIRKKTDDSKIKSPPQAPEVVIDRGVFLGVHEVTRKQFSRFRTEIRKVMFQQDAQNRERNELKLDAAEPNHPMSGVCWLEAVGFCHYLSELPEEKSAGRKYRLPTVAEWEYACRAGSTTRYCFGDSENELGDYAWFTKNSSGKLHPVGEKKPNAWGLYDMHGNAWEWCQDLVLNEAPPDGITPLRYGELLARRMQAMNQLGIKAPVVAPMRALCGWSYYNTAEQIGSSEIRSHYGETVIGFRGEAMWSGGTSSDIGFRVAMTVSKTPEQPEGNSSRGSLKGKER